MLNEFLHSFPITNLQLARALNQWGIAHFEPGFIILLAPGKFPL